MGLVQDHGTLGTGRINSWPACEQLRSRSNAHPLYDFTNTPALGIQVSLPQCLERGLQTYYCHLKKEFCCSPTEAVLGPSVRRGFGQQLWLSGAAWGGFVKRPELGALAWSTVWPKTTPAY